MRVNIFESVKSSCPQETEFDKIVYSMQHSQELLSRTQLYREHKENGNKAETEKMKQKSFPAFAPSALLFEGKAREDVIGLTDLCYLDFDSIKEERLLFDAMNKLRNDRNVLMASRSVSNEGLHILIRYKLKNMDAPPQRVTMTPDEMQKIYSAVYNNLASKYLQKLGLMPDYHARNMERLYIVSYDSVLYYNPNAEALTIDLNKPIDDERSIVMKVWENMREIERLTLKSRLGEAEKLIMECREWFVCNTSNTGEISKFDNHLVQIRSLKEIFGRVYELIKEVDEDLRNQNTEAAHEKIVECQHLLKIKMTGLYKQAISNVRKKVVKREKKLGTINREIKRKAV